MISSVQEASGAQNHVMNIGITYYSDLRCHIILDIHRLETRIGLLLITVALVGLENMTAVESCANSAPWQQSCNHTVGKEFMKQV